MMAKSGEVDGEKLAKNTRRLQTLPIGTPVAIQNQSGWYPNKWDKTGVIMEVRPYEQIMIKVDGSRRLTLRNRRFVRELDPRKTGLGNHPPVARTTAPQTPGPGRIRHYDVTPQPTPLETADEPTRDKETPTTEVMLPAQNDLQCWPAS
jgi:hypothetical protein